MPDPALLDRRILFFGGKGGVGKTTLASAVALLAAERGLRTLLVSTDPAHSTGDILEAEVRPEPTEILPGLSVMEIDPEREADRYIAGVKARIEQVTPPRLVAEVERQIDLARVTPGAAEAAIFDRFTRIMESALGPYDRLVFDTAPTGQTLRLLSLPELMATWIGGLISRRRKVGAMERMWRTVAGAAAGGERDRPDPVLEALEERKARFLRAREVLTDGARTAFAFVIIPERLPILETARGVEALSRHGIPVGGVVVNRLLPTEAEGAFLERRRAREEAYVRTIDETFHGYPRIRVPLADGDVVGIEALRWVAETVAAQGVLEHSRDGGQR